jgi:hypothetical protein
MSAFPRSLRSLQSEGFGSSLGGILFVALLMSAWLAWFFLARVTMYEVSESARLTGGAKAEAVFPLTSLGRIQVGQGAHVRLQAFPWPQYGTIRGRVDSIVVEEREGQVQVNLTLAPESAAGIPLQYGLPGSVEVEVGVLSPALLVLQAAGQRVTPASSGAAQNGQGGP